MKLLKLCSRKGHNDRNDRSDRRNEGNDHNNSSNSRRLPGTPKRPSISMEPITTTTASTKVFHLPELLENIISFVPKREILTRVQLVSHAWKTAVESPCIQSKLWRNKGKASAVMPTRIANEWIDDNAEDYGMPIYNMPIAINPFLRFQHTLYQNCVITSSLLISRKWSQYFGPNYSKRTMFVESLKSPNYPSGRPAFLTSPDFSWRSMQICNPPITSARLHAYSGAQLWDADSEDFIGLCQNFTMVSDTDGITMGLVHDTAAAILGSNTGKEDPKLGWHVYLSYGIQDRAEGDEIYGNDESDVDSLKGVGDDDSCRGESGGRRKKWWQWWKR